MDVDKTIEFILSQQAKNEAHIERHNIAIQQHDREMQ